MTKEASMYNGEKRVSSISGPGEGTLLNIMWQPRWKGNFRGRIDTCICMAESFCRVSEIVTALLIGYTSI